MNNKMYSGTFRIIHWAIAIGMLLLLITIFLRLTWMNKDNMAGIIQSYLETTGQTLSQENLIVLAKQIRQPMWNWHIYLGYFLVAMFSIRFTLPLFGKILFQSPFGKRLTGKEKFQRWAYIAFYFGVLVSLVTGLTIELGPKDLKVPMETIHVLSIYYFVSFIILHLGGVMLAEFTSQRGIISQVISGKQTSKDTEAKA